MNVNEQKNFAEKIRRRYTEKAQTDLDTLKALDAKVKRPANVFACVFGCLSAVIMGAGMSLVMTDIAEAVGIQAPMPWGIVIGIVGMLMAVLNYPIYKRILGSRRRKHADKIIALSNKILSGQ